MIRQATRAILAIALLGLCGCNTMAGIGKDIRAAGDALAKGAENARK